MKTKPNICIFCERTIEAGEVAKQGTYVVDGRCQKAWVHEACSWMYGVRNIVAALWRNLQEQRRLGQSSR